MSSRTRAACMCEVRLGAIDGTPILDIKPFATGFQPAGPVREPAWMRGLMREYY